MEDAQPTKKIGKIIYIHLHIYTYIFTHTFIRKEQTKRMQEEQT